MEVRRIDESLKPVFDELCRQQGSAFIHPDWISLYGDSIESYGIFDDADSMIGGFVLKRKKLAGFDLLRNPPYMPHNALFYKHVSSNPAARNGFHKKVLEALLQFLSKEKLSIKNVGFPKEYIDFQPFIWEKYKVVPRYTYVVDLQKEQSELWSQLAGERRNDLNKAEKDQVVAVLNDDPEQVIRLVMNSFSRNKANADRHMVTRIIKTMSGSGLAFSFTTYLNDRAIATAFCLTDRHTAFYILGGYDEVNRHKGAGALALWKSILYARETGLKAFDFEGSMIQPIERYFRGFGGTITPYFTVNKATYLLECGLKLFQRHQF